MSKAYSNKALPRGTVLREWRLEEVLGVGGFGIVYKARGIYFNELVAIKEYFPSAISERDEDATVVPVDSDAEEVHALGLKKFVEEAKLLWNLSSPSRHPNIVSVRSLFEIHGTAYMVMDFEDGTSLSKLLKNGVRFNESSLKEMIVPMAEGLERAHRVGVLHRDIKPPNIILNDSGKSVLIDFGSARFESGEATSTTVTFHTPPYAAIEQYVKTFQQGPWTDIYALGVVLFECVTGSKPPEVLERMHGTAGAPLSEGNWPGYSQTFLAAIDKAMMVRPEDRPKSISDWLPMLAADDSAGGGDEDDDFDQDVTRIMSFDAAAERIVPIAPPPPGFGTGDIPDTKVPDDPREAQFKKAGNTTDVGKRVTTEQEALQRKAPKLDTPAAAPAAGDLAPPAEDKAAARSAAPEAGIPAALAAAPPPPPAGVDRPPAGKTKAGGPQPPKAAVAGTQAGSKGKLILAASAAVLVVGAGVGWMMLGGDKSEPLALASSSASTPAAAPLELGALAPELTQLAVDARQVGIENRIITALIDQTAQIKSDAERLETLPAGAGATALSDGISQAAVKAGADFAAALLEASERQTAAAFRTYPWANPARSVPGLTSAQRQAAQRVQSGLASLQASNAAASSARLPHVAIARAHEALAQFGTLRTAIAGLAAAANSAAQPSTSPATAGRTPTPTAGQALGPVATPSQAAAPASSGGGTPLTATQRRQISRIVDQANDVARDVIRLERRDRSGANATAEEREGFAIRQADAQTAREYQAYLRNLEASMDNATTADGDRMFQQANQTLGYLRELLSRSNATLRR